MSGSARVVIDNVSHSFAGVTSADKRQVLDKVSFGVGDGEFVALVGKSGCGKTTLLNMVAGFISPTGGTVLVNGQPPATGLTAYMFARDNLLPWRRAASNVALAIELGSDRRDRGRRRQRAVELLTSSGCPGMRITTPASCPKACGSALHSRELWPWTRISGSWTSPSPLWTQV